MNFLGVLGQFGRLLPGYVEGQRAAYQDNWNDLNQFNAVQQGQIGNAFLESIFPYEVQSVRDNLAMQQMNARASAANLGLLYQQLPYSMQSNAMLGAVTPYLTNLQINQADPLYNQYRSYLLQQNMMQSMVPPQQTMQQPIQLPAPQSSATLVPDEALMPQPYQSNLWDTVNKVVKGLGR